MNKLILITTIELLKQFYPFFYEGFLTLRDNPETRFLDTEEQFRNTLLEAVYQQPLNAEVGVLVSKNNKPLGFGIVRNSTVLFQKKTAFIYAVYSNGKCATTTKELDASCSKWAKENNYALIRAATRRTSGASHRWFQSHGYKKQYTIYEKEVL